jgi:hypothetical protein
MRQTTLLFSLSLLALCLCANRCGDTDMEECYPYEQATEPIQLVSVLVVGQDSDGTIYVVDECGEDWGYCVYVSLGDTLCRKDILGGGHGSEVGVGEHYLFTIRNNEAESTVIVEIDEAGVAEMAVMPGDFEGFIDDVGQDGELLTVLGESAIDGMKVENLPGLIETEYLAEVYNGGWIIVTRPVYDWNYDDFRLFYGPVDNMIEREILEIDRVSDGGSTWITFAVDSSIDAVVYFGWDGANWDWGEAYLTIGEEQVGVTRLHPELEDMGRFTFFCIQ